MPTLVTDPALTVHSFPTVAVEIATTLTSGWTAVPHLYCDKLRLAVNAIDEATLSYNIGEGVVQPGASTFATYVPLLGLGKFVRITIDTTPSDIVWVGYCVSDEIAGRDAVKDVSGTNRLVGEKQILHCVGLEYFLARKQIDSAIVRRDSSSLDSVRIYRPLIFNGGAIGALDPTSGKRANRSPEINAEGEYDFAEQHEEAELWLADDILAHLLEYHTPRDSAGNPAPCPFILNLSDDNDGFLEGFTPTFDSEGKTVFDCLNELCRPQRGLVWWTQFVTVPETRVEIRVQSLATANVSLPGGGTLPLNGNQETLDFDGEIDVLYAQLKKLGTRDYDLIIARGARMTSTFTVGDPDQTLIYDWSVDGAPDAVGSEFKYWAGAKNDADYNNLSAEEKQKRNDAYRLSDEFTRVYQFYRIPADWNSKSGNGKDAPKNWAFPVLSSTGSVTGGLDVQPQGIRLLNRLRLKAGWDYSNPFSPRPASPTITHADLAKPFVFVKVSEAQEDETSTEESEQHDEKWQFVDKLDEADFAAGPLVSPNIGTTFDVEMQASAPGFILRPTNGMPHALALDHWSGAEPTQHEPEVDFETMRATICAEADFYCEGRWPAAASLPANKALNELVIHLGEHYRLDFLPAHTVVGLRNGEPFTSGETGCVLRDDRKYLEDVARLAYEWYKLDRQSMSVVFRQVRPLFELGMLITGIGAGSTLEALNTVVSSIEYDLINGQMRIDTEDDTVDVRSLVS